MVFIMIFLILLILLSSLHSLLYTQRVFVCLYRKRAMYERKKYTNIAIKITHIME